MKQYKKFFTGPRKLLLALSVLLCVWFGTAYGASAAGVDMVIANGADFHIIHKITEGRNYGTLFVSQSKEEVYLIDIIDRLL